MPEPGISVIVVNWNGLAYLPSCLGSLRAQTFRDFEVILVDNGSADASCDFVRQRFPEVRLISLAENTGFTGGNQVGLEAARAELIALLNNDAEADPQWLRSLWDASRSYPGAGSFASRMLFFDRRGTIENCGHALCFGGFTADLGRGEPDGPGWRPAPPVVGACGGAALYRRDMLRAVGFFDPDFFMIFEDFDLAFRAQLRGFGCRLVRDAIVYHRLGGSMRRCTDLQVFYSQRNIELAYWKNAPSAQIALELPARAVYFVGSALYFAMQGRGRAFLRGKLAALRLVPSTLRKRAAVQRARVVSAAELRRLMGRGGARGKLRKLRRALRPGPNAR